MDSQGEGQRSGVSLRVQWKTRESSSSSVRRTVHEHLASNSTYARASWWFWGIGDSLGAQTRPTTRLRDLILCLCAIEGHCLRSSRGSDPHIPCSVGAGRLRVTSQCRHRMARSSLRCEGGTGVVDGDVTWTVRVLDDHVSSTLASTLLACPPSLVARMAVCLYVALSRSQCHGRGRAIVLRCPLARLQEPHGAASGTSPRLLTFISVGRVPRQNAYTCVTQSVSSRRRRLQRPQRVGLLWMPLRYVIA